MRFIIMVLGITMFVLGMVAVAPSYAYAQIPTVSRIREIQYVGLKSVSLQDFEQVLPVSPGDPWRSDLVKKIETTIQQYYEKRGFYTTRVSVSAVSLPNRTVNLSVRIEEGEPCKIKSFWIDDPPNFKSKSVMMRFKSQMHDVAAVHPGDRFDESALADRSRILRDWLVSENYIMANTDKVRLTFNDARTEVDVVFVVDYGDRVTFGYQGNTVFSKAELDEFVSIARATGLGKDYVGTIERRFVEEYKVRAYNGVQVINRITEGERSKHITFFFNEGIRSELHEIAWEGLSEENQTIAKEIFEKNSTRLIQRGYFVDRDVDKGILMVLENMRARGYLSAKLVAKAIQNVKSPKGTHRVRVVVQLSEGENTTVGRVELDGFKYIPLEKVLSILGLVEGHPFNPFAMEEGLQKLKALYVGEGFLQFKFTSNDKDVVAFSQNNRMVFVKLQIDEGPRIKVGRIIFRGLAQTAQYVAEREVEIKTGDWWIGAAVTEVEVNLKKLGIFSEVKVTPVASELGTDYRDMIIEMKEVEPGILEAGPGFRSDLGVRAFARLSYNNILGKNWIGVLSAEANRRIENYRFVEYDIDTSFVEPRLFSTKNQVTVGASTKLQSFPTENFNAVSTSFATSFQRPLSKIISSRITYRLERIRQFDVQFQNEKFAVDNRTMLIGSFVPSISLDTRDNPFTTTSGVLATVSLEYAHPNFSLQSIDDSGAPAYQKWNASVRGYIPVSKDIVWSNVVSGGFARSNIAGREIPLIKLYRLGGYSTIRGYREDSINVDTKIIQGTLTLLNFRTQLDLPLVGELKLAPFLDAGNLFIDEMRNQPFFKAGAGAGLHYMTPIGPINLDWGYKLNPAEGDQPYQIHFSVGMI